MQRREFLKVVVAAIVCPSLPVVKEDSVRAWRWVSVGMPNGKIEHLFIQPIRRRNGVLLAKVKVIKENKE